MVTQHSLFLTFSKKLAKFGMLFEIFTKKEKVKMTFGHKATISSLTRLHIKSKTSFTNVAQFGILIENVAKKLIV